MSAIEVINLQRDFQTTIGVFKRKKKTVTAVKDISFEIAGGELFGLLGPNGAGEIAMHILNGMIGVLTGFMGGWLLFHIDYSATNPWALLLTILVTTFSTAGLGLHRIDHAQCDVRQQHSLFCAAGFFGC